MLDVEQARTLARTAARFGAADRALRSEEARAAQDEVAVAIAEEYLAARRAHQEAIGRAEDG